MAFSPLSTGDVLMLSQQAWRIGRAFTQGRSGAASEFEEVEREANGISEALKLTAEILYANDSILSRAEFETRGAVYEILESAGRTLGDLESFVDRYQVIRKRKTDGGFVVERSWSEIILANYKTIKWTTEGGDITELRNILHVHTNTINLTMQALQSKSLARLERTVMPMAESIASIHSRVNGDLGDKIDDVHRMIMSLSNSSPSLTARDRSTENSLGQDSGRRDTVSSSVYPPDTSDTQAWTASSQRSNLRSSNNPQRQQQQHDSVLSTPASVEHSFMRSNTSYPSRVRLSLSENEGGRADWDFETGSPSRLRGSLGTTLEGVIGSTSESEPHRDGRSPDRRVSSTPRRESSTLPDLFGTMSIDNVRRTHTEPYPRPNHARLYERAEPRSSGSFGSPPRLATRGMQLPPPAIPVSPTGPECEFAETVSLFSIRRHGARDRADSSYSPQAQQSNSHGANVLPLSPTIALSSLPAFERSLFRNAAILCDVRAKLVEYAQKVPDEPDPRYDVKMVEACKECHIRVIRKRENRAHGGTKVTTSIWAISEDGVVRCQQKLQDYVETVPYCSYFEPEKVSISANEAVEIVLRFHGENWIDEVDKEVKTHWVNYIFVTETDAIAFQSAVFGRSLLGSFRTTKTTVIHDGFMGTFAFEEQFANIEMLRLWEDDGTATPGAQGGVLALMHISSNFGEGWARWWMNCSRRKVRVRDDPPKHAKLKGIDVIVVKPGERTRKASTTAELQRANSYDESVRQNSCNRKVAVKKVTGIRIEFKTDEEKDHFVEMACQAQERLLPLPDL